LDELIEATTLTGGRPAREDEEVQTGELSGGAEHSEAFDGTSVLVHILRARGEPIHDMTTASRFNWAPRGTESTVMEDKLGGFLPLTRCFMSRLALSVPDWRYWLTIDADVGVPWYVPYLLGKLDLPAVSAVVPNWSDSKGLFANIGSVDSAGTKRFHSLQESGSLPSSGVVEVQNTGTGCLMVRRDVLEALWARYKDDPSFGMPFEVPLDEQRRCAMTGVLPRGEDVCFTDRVRAAGFKVYACFDAHCAHRKPQNWVWPVDARSDDLSVDDWKVAAADMPVILG
jgi:hypothetical protein